MYSGIRKVVYTALCGFLNLSGCGSSEPATDSGSPMRDIEPREDRDLTFSCTSYPWKFLQFGSDQNDSTAALGLDSSCTLFIAGNTDGKLTTDTDRGMHQDGFVAKIETTTQPQWIHQIGSASVDTVRGVAVDPADGTTYVVGDTNDLVRPLASRVGGRDAFVVAVAPGGIRRWIQNYGTIEDDFGQAVSLRSDGTLLMAGSTFGDLTRSSDIWMLELQTDGTQTNEKTLGTDEYDRVEGITLDPNNDDIYVTGSTSGDIGGSNAGSFDAFLAKYGVDYTPSWVQQRGTSDIDAGLRVVRDDKGNLYLLVTSYSDLIEHVDENDGYPSSFLFKYSPTGTPLWSKRIGALGYSTSATGLAVDQVSGAIYVAGSTTGKLADQPHKGGRDAFLAKFRSDGSLRWLQQFGTVSDDYATAVVVTAKPQILVGGTTGGTLGIKSTGKNDVFIARFFSDGKQE